MSSIDTDEVADMYRGGMSAPEIADEFDVSSTTIYRILDEKNIERRGQKKAQNKVEIDNLEDLYVEEMMSVHDIAEEYDCSPQTVCNRLEDAGIDGRDQMEYHIDKPPTFQTKHRGYENWRHHWRGELDEVRVHRLLAVALYGFDDVKNKIVHHKNKIPWDNRPSNIELMRQSQHATIHMNERWGNE